MSNKDLKNLIDGILNEKIGIIHARIDSTVNKIISQFEQVKDLDELSKYKIPEEFEKKLAAGVSGGTDNTIDTVHKFIKKISGSVNQLNLITNFLESINHFCSRAALFLVRDDKLVGWKGRGFSVEGSEIDDKEIKRIFFSLSADTIFKSVLERREPYSGPPQSQSDDHLIYSRFGGNMPDKIYVLPFFVKGKPQAVTYTDSLEGKPIREKEIEILTSVGEMSLDLLPLRQKILSRVKTKEFVDEAEEPEKEQEQDNSSEFKTSPEDSGVEDQPVMPAFKENDPERLARVIINDIILYNRQVVEDGLVNKNLFSVLQDTILQSKELYLNKYTDIAAFEKQLVETLAKGDKEALNGYEFETL
jgi:hypothetical protein